MLRQFEIIIINYSLFLNEAKYIMELYHFFDKFSQKHLSGNWISLICKSHVTKLTDTGDSNIN